MQVENVQLRRVKHPVEALKRLEKRSTVFVIKAFIHSKVILIKPLSQALDGKSNAWKEQFYEDLLNNDPHLALVRFKM